VVRVCADAKARQLGNLRRGPPRIDKSFRRSFLHRLATKNTVAGPTSATLLRITLLGGLLRTFACLPLGLSLALPLLAKAATVLGLAVAQELDKVTVPATAADRARAIITLPMGVFSHLN
jgi:hypothetical protein